MPTHVLVETTVTFTCDTCETELVVPESLTLARHTAALGGWQVATSSVRCRRCNPRLKENEARSGKATRLRAREMAVLSRAVQGQDRTRIAKDLGITYTRVTQLRDKAVTRIMVAHRHGTTLPQDAPYVAFCTELFRRRQAQYDASTE